MKGLERGNGLEKDEGRKELLGLPEGGSVSDRMRLSGWSGVLYGWVDQSGRSNLSLKVDWVSQICQAGQTEG